MASVSRISISPVKSTRLRHPSSVRLEAYGAVGNRRFLLTEPDGSLINAADDGPLLRVETDYDPGAGCLSVRFPDGSTIEGEAAATGDRVLTNLWGRPVEGARVAGPFAEAFSDYLGRTVLLVRPDDPGAANDDAPASLVSRASVEELARRSGRPPGSLDARRFRMLLELDGCEAHEEDTWEGRRVAVGEATIEVLERVPRCVITTKDPRTGEKDFDTLKAIAAYRPLQKGEGIPFGMWAKVVEPGTVSVGDRVVPAPD